MDSIFKFKDEIEKWCDILSLFNTINNRVQSLGYKNVDDLLLKYVRSPHQSLEAFIKEEILNKLEEDCIETE